MLYYVDDFFGQLVDLGVAQIEGDATTARGVDCIASMGNEFFRARGLLDLQLAQGSGRNVLAHC